MIIRKTVEESKGRLVWYRDTEPQHGKRTEKSLFSTYQTPQETRGQGSQGTVVHRNQISGPHLGQGSSENRSGKEGG